MREAFVPYGAYWCAPFVRWRGSFSHLHPLEFAAHVGRVELAARSIALADAGLAIGDIDCIKSHNPFAVNDAVFARAFNIDWRKMNNYGCSLVWGHPQGPTGLRAMIEMIEELALRGGGRGLFHSCAAGDSAMAVVLEVRNSRRG